MEKFPEKREVKKITPEEWWKKVLEQEKVMLAEKGLPVPSEEETTLAYFRLKAEQEKITPEKAFESYQSDFELSAEDLQKPLLDVGANYGAFIQYLREVLHNKMSYGVEYQEHRVLPWREGGIVGSGVELPFVSDSFEVVVAHDYMPMFYDQDPEIREKSLMEPLRVLKRGGFFRFNISTPESELELEDGETEPYEYAEERYQGALSLERLLEDLKGKGYGVDKRLSARGKDRLIVTIIKQ